MKRSWAFVDPRRRALGLGASSLITVAMLASAPTAAPLFTARYLSYATGSDPIAIAIADLNRDGKLDVATANRAARTVSVLLGNGDGTFEPRQDVALANAPLEIAVADFDSDTNPDLILADSPSASVTVLIGLGDGQFATGPVVPVAPVPLSMQLTDLNADGKTDVMIAASTPASGTLTVLIGRGDASFQRTDIPVGAESRGLAVGDVSGDGHVDLIVGRTSRFLSIFLGHGNGSFTEGPTVAIVDLPRRLFLRDVNSDTRLDLLIDYASTNTISVQLGNGNSTFGTSSDIPLPSNSCDVVWGDPNADGKPDLLTPNCAYSVSVRLGNGDGTFGPASSVPAGISPHALAVGDLNGDGKEDAAVTGGENVATILLGNGDGTFGVDLGFQAGAKDIALGDLNGDRNLDLVSTAVGVEVRLGDGHGNFGTALALAAGAAPSAVTIGFVNTHGYPDLAVTNHFSNSVSVFLGRGDGTFQPQLEYVTRTIPVDVVIADFDRDGRPDLAVANGGSDTVSVLFGNGDGTFRATLDWDASDGPLALAAGDLNGDGRVDLAIANPDGNAVSVLIWLEQGFAPPVSLLTGRFHQDVELGDLDGDGQLDLTVANGVNTVSVLRGRGDGTFDPETDYEIGNGGPHLRLRVHDLNADGKLDLAVTNGAGNSVSMLVGRGDGTFEPRVDFGTSSYPLHVDAGDLDGDGKADLVSAGAGRVFVLLNRTRRTPVDVESVGGPRATILHQPFDHASGGPIVIRYSLSQASMVRFTVYDVRGREIRGIDGGARSPGEHLVTWDRRDARMHALSRGMYFVRLRAGSADHVRKLILMHRAN